MPLFAAALAVTTIATVEGARQQRKAAKTEQQRVAFQNRRSRIEAMAEQRRLRAEQFASAEAMGASSGSGVQGAMGSTATQTFSNIGVQQSISSMQRKQLAHQSRAATMGAVAQIGSSVMKNEARIKDVFS